MRDCDRPGSILFAAFAGLMSALLAAGCAGDQSGPGGSGGATAAGGSRANGGGGSRTTSAGGTSLGSGGSVNAGAGGTHVAGGGGTSNTGSGGAAGVGSTGSGASGDGGSVGSGGAAAGGHGGATATGGTSGGGAGASGHTGPCDIWVAPDGSDANPGTEALPVLTPQHAYDLLCLPVAATAGDLCMGSNTTMCLKAGTYKLTTRIEFKKTRMGTATKVITMMADPAASAKPVLDFSGQARLACEVEPANNNIYGIDIGADWYRVSGLEIAGTNDSGIVVQGAHDVVENCVVHDAEDTGVLISSGSGYTGSGTYNTIKNVDSYHNHDERCQGANADGFGAKKGTGVGNVFDGCRSWDNSDDGFDFFDWASPVTVTNSWAFNMGATTAGSQSNGNGFKMGSPGESVKHVMSGLFGFYNDSTQGTKSDWGVTANGNSASMTCTGCGAWNNGKGNFENITHTGDVTAKATPAAASAAKRNADGSLPDITKL